MIEYRNMMSVDDSEYSFNSNKPSEIKVWVENEDEERIVKHFLEAFLLRKRKGRDYKNVWKELGVRKEFVYLYDKVHRLKSLIWDQNKPANESTRDTIIDMINYAHHTLILLEDEINKQNGEQK